MYLIAQIAYFICVDDADCNDYADNYKLLTLLYIDLEMSVVLKLTNSPSFFPVSFR